MTLLEQIIHSPRLPQYFAEIKEILSAERAKREKFFEELKESQKAEFINGEVVVQSPVKLEHDDASVNLLVLMRSYVSKHSLGHVGHEKLFISLTRNDYEPDICYFKEAKAAKFKPDQMKFPAPDLIVEVLSSSTEKMDRTIKFEDYALHGVDEYWMVDPKKRTIEQYLLGGDTYQLAVKVKDGNIRSRAIKGFEIPVRAVFDSKTHLRVLKQIIES